MVKAVLNGGAASRQFWVSVAGVGVFVLSGFVTGVIWISALQQQAIQAKVDHEALAARVALLETEDRQNLVSITSLREKLVEVETQFHAADQLGDIRIAEDLRFQCDVKQKLFQIQCAPYSYFPQIARQPPQ